MRARLLDVRLRHNLRRQVQPLAQVVETLGRQGVVVPLPAELGLEEAARGERLAGLDDEEVLGVDLAVLALEVLLRDEHALAEEVLVDLLAVGLGDQPVNAVSILRNGMACWILVLLTSWRVSKNGLVEVDVVYSEVIFDALQLEEVRAGGKLLLASALGASRSFSPPQACNTWRTTLEFAHSTSSTTDDTTNDSTPSAHSVKIGRPVCYNTSDPKQDAEDSLN